MPVKAYNPRWAHHQAMQAAAGTWQQRGLLTGPQLAAVQAAYPLDYYRPNIFLRVTLFLFTGLGTLAGSGFLGLFLYEGLFRESSSRQEEVLLVVTALLSAAACLFVLEAAIRSSRLYHSGVDNALLYATLGWLVFVVLYVTTSNTPVSYYGGFLLFSPYLTAALLLILALLLAATSRYADRLVAAAAYCTYLLLLANISLRIPGGRLLLPFVLMLASGGAYLLVRRLTHRPDYLYYKPCLTLLKALTLLTFYLGGNYWVVREGNGLLSDAPVSGQVPFAWVFYVFTAVIPVAYVVVGLRRFDRIWLWVGLLIVGFSLFTLRYYRSLLPPEVAATLAGSVLVATMLWVARYLRTPQHGLTAASDGDEDNQKFNLESLIVAQTATVPQPEAPGFQFGGGSSGGGGADGSY
ncbi:hypothetical protein [Hymenobacter norwichensis]|uniref:hypothetical protein n=1 Tax=Hymenobacter norwichensis TaxID=223903 RepID=UPI0003B300DF|nr:hypothetical protein [Hymenobacter norwichensis]